MKKQIRRWMRKEASWYEFWMPQSGVLGGFVLGSTLGYVLVISLVIDLL